MALKRRKLRRRYARGKQDFEEDLKMSSHHGMFESSAGYLLRSVISNAEKHPKGRRWPLNDKILSLALLKRGPRAYRLLHSTWCFPSPRTLTNMIQGVNLHARINEGIFSILSLSMKAMSEKDRLCYLIFDEMSIKENLRYNPKLDVIDGVEDLGHLGRTARPTKYALVFMLRGLVRKWKQPISFYFSASGMSSNDLQLLIKEVLQHCRDAGCIVLATVCDMGTNNRTALKLLGSSPCNPFFHFEEQKVVTLFDAPHILKCCRNALLNHDIVCSIDGGEEGILPRGRAEWQHIVSYHEVDCSY